jgi:hypothetical protein
MDRFSSFADQRRSRLCLHAAVCLMAMFLFLGASGVTLARQVKITVTGTVTSGVDETGVFGAKNSKLDGQDYTQIFIVDDTKGTKTIVTGNPPYASKIAATTGSNPVTATLTIGGHTVYYGVRATSVTPNSLVSRQSDQMYISTGGENYWVGKAVGEGSLEATINFASPPYTANYNWESALDYTTAANNTSGGSFVIAYGSSITGEWLQSANGLLKIKNITEIAPPPSLILSVTDNGKLVPEGNTVFISGGSPPVMPRLYFQILGYTAAQASSVQWSLYSTYPRRAPLDDHLFEQTVPITQAWDFSKAVGSQFFGGDLTVIGDGMAGHFHILGQNPHYSDALAFINAHAQGFRFAWAIFRHESRLGTQVYNQFNPSGTFINQPNFGPSDGWGIAQLDGNGLGRDITSNEVWNWQTNVLSGIVILNEKHTETLSYFQALKRKWGSLYEDPPATVIVPGTKTPISPIEASDITLYNGASVQTQLPSPNNTTILYNSCWEFNPNGLKGNKWTLVPSQNNYLFLVIHNEVEGYAKTTTQ